MVGFRTTSCQLSCCNRPCHAADGRKKSGVLRGFCKPGYWKNITFGVSTTAAEAWYVSAMAEPSSELQIRPAVAADCSLILSLIRELAAFERLADEVVATVEDLQRSLFGPRPGAEVVIAEVAGNPVGFALYFGNFSTFLGRPGLYLEDLFVRAQHRGQGVGRALLGHLAAIARERGCGRFEWAVLDWNRKAIDFYESLGAQALDDWTIYRVTGDALERM